MKLLTLSILACCLTLGCASGTLPTPDGSIQPAKVLPPASQTQAPKRLPPSLSGKGPALEANHQEVGRQYHLLAAEVCSLLKFLEINRDECDYWLRPAPDLR